jgi:hypothetical protein
MVMPTNLAFFSAGRINSYLPSTMQHSTIPLQDQDDLINAIKWLNLNHHENSCVLIHHALLPWTRLYPSETITRIYYVLNIKDALDLALKEKFNYIYLIWWNTEIGWYKIAIPDHFEEVYRSGRISIFQHKLNL